MKVLGLTGGIGSGKTAASDYLATQGINVVDADIVSRQIVLPDQPAWQAIVERYGDSVLQPDQTLDRAWLRNTVFSDDNERHWLEQQTHPRIHQQIVEQLQATRSPYAILVSPLLFESGQIELTQRSLMIDVPESLQLQRASQRDHNTEEQIRRIIAAQMPREKKRELADDIVDNSRNIEYLHQQLHQLHCRYLREFA